MELKYRSYTGQTNCNDAGKIKYVRIEGMNDYIAFHTENLEDGTCAISSCIDTYLKACELLGKKPDKQYPPTIEISLLPKYQKILDEEAHSQKCSMQELIIKIIEQNLLLR